MNKETVSFLNASNLSTRRFEEQHILTMADLCLLSIDDLKEMKLTIGERNKLLDAVSQWQTKQREATVQWVKKKPCIMPHPRTLGLPEDV